MAETKNCQQCGKQLPANAPRGICPACLLKLGLPTDVGNQPPADPQQAIPTSATPPGGFIPPEPAELAGRFPQLEILEILGAGGMGAVYKARQKQLDRVVALKILPPEVGRDPAFAERFAREARSMAQLNHPNVVTLYEFGRTDDGLFFFLMEFVDGTDLRQVIRAGSLEPDAALLIVPQICEALHYAHSKSIVHRDIKPENVLLDQQGHVKIADFGLARLLDLHENTYTLTQTQQRMGTPHYMAPEQIGGAHTVDHRADIYSLGVVFYEMLTGQLPIGHFAPPSEKVHIDVRLDTVVLKTLATEPERRYQHASEVKTDVETIAGSEPYSRPVPAEPVSTNAFDDHIAQRLNLPSIGLIIAGATNALALAPVLVMIAGGLLTSGRRFIPGVDDETFVVLCLLWTVVGVVTTVGALRMRTLTGYRWALVTAVVAALPVSPGALIGLPIGIWALLVLSDNDVKTAFARASRRSPLQHTDDDEVKAAPRPGQPGR